VKLPVSDDFAGGHREPPFEPAAQLIDVSLIAGAVMMWLGLRKRQEWVRGIGGAAAGIFAVLMLYGLVVLHRRIGDHLTELPVNLAVLTTGASLLTLSLLTSEVDAFWAARGAADAWSIAREGLQAIAWSGKTPR
jgi:hypothetical protein